MEIFLDTAHIPYIREGVETGVVEGVTTNPTLLAKEGNNPLDQLKTIAEIVPGDVSAEVVAQNYEGMLEEARFLASLAPNIVVKIPMTRDGLKAIRTLSQEGIRVNTTLIFTPLQALLAAKAGAYIVSPFVGRLDDITHNGMRLIRQIIEIFSNYEFATKVLVASIRHPRHVLKSALYGADIVTLPYSVFEKILKHPLTDIGLERFLKDWEKAGFEPLLKK